MIAQDDLSVQNPLSSLKSLALAEKPGKIPQYHNEQNYRNPSTVSLRKSKGIAEDTFRCGVETS